MIKYLLFIFLIPSLANAEAIANMPNKAGGKIVLTDEVCKHKGKTYDGLYRGYNYSKEGYSDEGCYKVEDETIVMVWKTEGDTMRYPLENFTAVKRKPATRYGT